MRDIAADKMAIGVKRKSRIVQKVIVLPLNLIIIGELGAEKAT